MKKLILFVVLLLALGTAAYFTRPTLAEHKIAIREAVSEMEFSGIAELEAKVYLEAVLGCVEERDYLVCTVCVLPTANSEQMLSLGIFGKVFTIRKNNITENLLNLQK